MESSRNSLISTLLMTLPLIVVPAIALLRPPTQSMGVSTSRLDANESDKDEFMDEFEIQELDLEAIGKSTEKPSQDLSTEFGGLFEEVETKEAPERVRPPNRSDSFDPFAARDDSPPNDETVSVPESSTSTEQIVEQLNIQGALRTMWFEAGQKSPVGFAAFFRGQTELMRIRFEAVGQSREECARNVLDQVNRWQAAQAAEEP